MTAQPEPVEPGGEPVAAEPPARRSAGSVLLQLGKVALALGLIVWLVRSNAIDPQKIGAVLSKPWIIAGVMLLGAFNLSTSALRWRLLLAGEGIECSLGLALRLTWIGHFWNMVVPGAVSGDAVKMFYIGRAAPSKREEAWTTVFADRLIGMAALVALSTLAMLIEPSFMMSRPELRATAAVMFTILLGLVGLGTVLALGIGRGSTIAGSLRERLAGKSSLIDTLRRGYHSLLRLGRRPGLLAATFAISFFSHAMAVVLAFVLGHHGLGEDKLSFLQYCMVVPVALFSNAIPITPGGIGQGEFALGALFEWTGGQSADGVTIMILNRLMFLGLAFVGALLYATYRGVPPPSAAPPQEPAPSA